MSLKEEERNIIVSMEMEKAEQTFAESEVLKNAGLWSNLANRLYYALFHAVSAMLIHDRREVGTHRGVVLRFQQYYVKTGIFTTEDGAFYSQMQSLREKADYNCYFDVVKVDILPRIEPTRQLIDKIKHYITETDYNIV